MPCYSSYTDYQLTCLLKDGDRDAFTEIHKRYYGILYRHARRSLADGEEIKDILQDIFLYVWNNKTAVDPGAGIGAYLYSAVRNKLLNNFRHTKIKDHYISTFQVYIDNNQAEPDETLRLKQLVSVVEAEVARLPPKMRLIFEMSRNANLSHKEIADDLNISVFTVRKQINNSLKVLRLKFGNKFFLFFF